MAMVNQAYLSRSGFPKLLSLCVIATCGMLMSGWASAEMTPLDTNELSSVQGSGTGVQLSLNAAINGTVTAGDFTPNASCVSAAGLPGSAAGFCRFGFQENNVNNWLLLKGFSGYFNIPKLVLFGSTVSPASGLQSAIALQITLPSATDKSSQININNFSFTFALATSPCYSNSGGTVSSSCSSATPPTAAQNQAAYYDASVFQGTSSTAQYYSPVDAGKETGILGVRMSGNLNVGGTLYVFSK
jgi:hypothetical protein